MNKSIFYGGINELLKQRRTLLRNHKKTGSVKGKIKNYSAFSKNTDMPLQVTGSLIGEGSYKDSKYGETYLTSEELKRTMDNWVGKYIFKNHKSYIRAITGKDFNIDDIVGIITNVEWDDQQKEIKFYGEIHDRNIASKVGKLIKYVSVGFFNDILNVNGMWHKTEIEPQEVSLVYDPMYKNASIRPA